MSEAQTVVVAQRPAEVERFMPVMSMNQAVERHQIIVDAVKKLMDEGEDYGIIPGTKKPTLLQPGADKLNNLFGLVPRFDTMERVEDWVGRDHGGEPFFYYRVKCKLLRGDYVMGEGEGSCNSWESKYRYRKTERQCPQCGKETIIKGKVEYGGGWLCFAKRGGCGAKYKDGDESIEGQVVGQKPNPDVAEVVNTVLKMACKRAKIAATLNATSAHEFFTQDVEDMPGSFPVEDVAERRIAEEKAKAEAAQQTPRPAPAVPTGPFETNPDILTAWKRMRDFNSTVQLFSDLKTWITDLAGADAPYYEILHKHGMEHRNDLRGRSGKAIKAVVKELIEYVQKCRAALEPPPYEATDDDVPAEIGGVE